MTSLFTVGNSPKQHSLRLFPPCFPQDHDPQLSASSFGELFERFTEAWLTEHFPDAHIVPKAKLHINRDISFECDIVIFMPPRVPLKPDFYIVECKNFKKRLPHYFLIELWWRVHASGAKRGLLFLSGTLSRRSREIAELLGIKVLKYTSQTNTFNPLSHEDEIPLLSPVAVATPCRQRLHASRLRAGGNHAGRPCP